MGCLCHVQKALPGIDLSLDPGRVEVIAFGGQRLQSLAESIEVVIRRVFGDKSSMSRDEGKHLILAQEGKEAGDATIVDVCEISDSAPMGSDLARADLDDTRDGLIGKQGPQRIAQKRIDRTHLGFSDAHQTRGCEVGELLLHPRRAYSPARSEPHATARINIMPIVTRNMANIFLLPPLQRLINVILDQAALT